MSTVYGSSGKTTLLNTVYERLREVDIKPIRLEGRIALNKMRMDAGLALYQYFAWETFHQRLSADEFRARLLQAHGVGSTSKICFLFDGIQSIQDSPQTGELFDWLAVNSIPFIRVGTFQLKALEGRLGSEHSVTFQQGDLSQDARFVWCGNAQLIRRI